MAMRLASQTAFPAEEPEFQVAPMIDVLLVLMTFFMSITSTEVLRTKTHQVEIRLPPAPNSRKITPDPSEIILNVGWNAGAGAGVIECEEQVLKSPADVTRRILERKGNRPQFSAVVRGSREVPYHYMQQVMRACAEAGVDDLTFAVMDREGARSSNSGERR